MASMVIPLFLSFLYSPQQIALRESIPFMWSIDMF